MGSEAENIHKTICFSLWREIRVNVNHSIESLRSVLVQEETPQYLFIYNEKLAGKCRSFFVRARNL